jgi:hypothetical protein
MNQYSEIAASTEASVLRLIRQGLTRTMIRDRLSIGTGTVEKVAERHGVAIATTPPSRKHRGRVATAMTLTEAQPNYAAAAAHLRWHLRWRGCR